MTDMKRCYPQGTYLQYEVVLHVFITACSSPVRADAFYVSANYFMYDKALGIRCWPDAGLSPVCCWRRECTSLQSFSTPFDHYHNETGAWKPRPGKERNMTSCVAIPAVLLAITNTLAGTDIHRFPWLTGMLHAYCG